MQLLCYIDTEYSSNLVRKFVTALETCSEEGFECEVTIIFDEYATTAWKSPVVVTIKNSNETGLIISSQRFYKAGSKHNGHYLFQQIYSSLLPEVVALGRESLLMSKTIPNLTTNTPNNKMCVELLTALRIQLDDYFCFYSSRVGLTTYFERTKKQDRRKKIILGYAMSNYSIIQFVK